MGLPILLYKILYALVLLFLVFKLVVWAVAYYGATGHEPKKKKNKKNKHKKRSSSSSEDDEDNSSSSSD
jgi:anionic cell wall polymer biosynthesis LytR-Cps2A-Psr (LCP) family protein